MVCVQPMGTFPLPLSLLAGTKKCGCSNVDIRVILNLLFSMEFSGASQQGESCVTSSHAVFLVTSCLEIFCSMKISCFVKDISQPHGCWANIQSFFFVTISLTFKNIDPNIYLFLMFISRYCLIVLQIVSH